MLTGPSDSVTCAQRPSTSGMPTATLRLVYRMLSRGEIGGFGIKNIIEIFYAYASVYLQEDVYEISTKPPSGGVPSIVDAIPTTST